MKDTIHLHPLEKPISAVASLPGCIGYTIRALAIAAMTKGSVRVVHPLKSDDTLAMFEALETLGIATEEGPGHFTVHGDVSDIKDAGYEISVGLSGRMARTILALLCVVPGTKTLTCDEPFKKRPIGDLVDGLRQLGAKITYLEKDGCLPVKIASSTLLPGTVRMNGEVSSQYFSAIMMVAPLVAGDIAIEVLGEQSSRPYIDMTMGIMKDFGVTATNHGYRRYHIAAGQHYVNPKTYVVEPEATSASYFFAIAALTGSTMRILHLGPDSLQGDIRFVETLERMGCKVRSSTRDRWIEVTGTGELRGVTVDMNDTPDLVVTLAVVAAFAKGTTTITNIAHARVKETDRIASPQAELAKMDIKTEATEDTLTIHGGTPHGASIDTYHDHRMAMAFAVAGTKIPGVVVKDPEVVNKSFPEFWDVLASLERGDNIVLAGLRGSGKTTIGKLLAKRLGWGFIDMDVSIEKDARMSIAEMVAEHGWQYFRDKESALAARLQSVKQTVIATGGGALVRPENVTALKASGHIVLLEASVDTQVKRIREEMDNRPALTDAKDLPAELHRLHKERDEHYHDAAELRIETDRLTPEAIADQILSKLRK
jgi:3-phosphoshikimate 1-carboxyvinyltransferase